MTTRSIAIASRARSLLFLLMVFLSFGLHKAASSEEGIVKLGWTPGLGGSHIALAIDANLFEKHGVKVETVKFATGREALEALIGGQIDLAMLAEFPAVTAAMRAQDFRILSVLARYRGNRVVINKASGATDLASLAGKKVGTTVGTNMHYMTDSLFRASGIQFQLTNVAPGDIVPALARGDIAAGVMFDSFFPKARQALGDDYLEIMTPGYPTTMILAASTAILDGSREAAGKIVAALVEGESLLDKPAAAQAAVVRVIGGALTAEAAAQLWPDYEIRMTLDQALVDLMLAESKWIASRGLVKEEISEDALRDYIDEGPLAEAARDRVTLP